MSIISNTKDSFIQQKVLDGMGGLANLNQDSIKQNEWIHLEGLKKDSLKWLKNKDLLPNGILEELFAKSVRPRTINTIEGTLFFLKGVFKGENKQSDKMVSLRVWFQNDLIITLSKEKVLSIDLLQKLFRCVKGPKNISEFILSLINLMNENKEGLIEELSIELDELEECIFVKNDLDSTKLSSIRSKIIMFLRNITPQKKALEVLSKSHFLFFSDEQKNIFLNLQDEMISFIENLKSNKDRAEVLKDEIRANLTETLNRNMYMISIISFLFLPLTFITSLLGAHLGGTPGINNPNGFNYLIVVIGGAFAIQVVIMLLTKWMRLRAKSFDPE